MPQITEWEFTSKIASRIDAFLAQDPSLPFKEARTEARTKGDLKRSDLTLFDKRGKAVLTGEVKMPDSPAGRSPFQQGVVEDAHKKADKAAVDYNFTWNVNRFVLWKTYERGKSITERYIEHIHVLPSPIHNSDDVRNPLVEKQIDDFLKDFLGRYARLLSDAQPMLLLPLDEKFIVVYEASLEQPVAQTLAAINFRYQNDKIFKRDLNEWMLKKQEWVLSERDEAILRENLERAAKFSCYMLANKIVFYKALRRRFPRMRALRIAKTLTTGSDLARYLSELFSHAIEYTGDYETVFQNDFGSTLPALSDVAVDSWRDLSEQTDGFDFTQLNHEIVGQIFERLLSTTERHKFGQHYTRSEIVDLINAFCIRKPEARVMDPACGGGTFLVRAYARKRELSDGKLNHSNLIAQLFGFDISPFAANLTTINLVTRDLIDDENYPRVAQEDFFNMRPNSTPFVIPFGDNRQQVALEAIGKMDAVVGNPPYIRQEKIGEYYGGAEYKRKLQQEIAEREAPGIHWSGRSDIHVYFFPHAASFLQEGGYLGLLTSSTWLDTTYGFRLQKYLLDNFEIIAIIESASEPWFTGARVTTAATILRRQSDPAKRAANIVHFVKLQRDLSDILKGMDDAAQREFFERFRAHVNQLTSNELTTDYQIRSIRQNALYDQGRLQIQVSADDEADEDENGAVNNEETARQSALREQSTDYHLELNDEYFGYKWGVYLRAPKIFFTLTELAPKRLVPLAEIAQVDFGVKTGADDFFYPYDITKQELARFSKPQDFKAHYGIRTSETSELRIIKAGDGSVHLVESRFLEPEVHSLMEIDSVRIKLANLKHCIFLCPMTKDELRKNRFSHTLSYIRWGEKEGFDQRSTVSGRAVGGHLWYDLTNEQRPDMILPKLQQYRHIVALNSEKYFCNSSLLEVFKKGADEKTLCAILNSTVSALFKQFFARIHGREGSLQLDVYSARMMPIPDARLASALLTNRLHAAVESMLKREALRLLDVDGKGEEWSGELAQKDRQELDDAVLELLGIENADERKQLRAELYSAMTQLYREIRATEKKMQKFRTMTARRGRPSPKSLADEIWETLEEKPVAKSLADFVSPQEKTETFLFPATRATTTKNDMFNPHSLKFGGHYIPLGSPERVEFGLELANQGISGQVNIPTNPAVAQAALNNYRAHVAKLDELFQESAAAYTADEKMQERIINELWRKAQHR